MIGRRARLRIVYVELGTADPPIVWVGDLPHRSDKSLGDCVHPAFDRIVDHAHYDRTNGNGRVVRAGRSLLVETRIGHDSGRPLRATVVVSSAGGWPGWAKGCAGRAASVLCDHGLPTSADELRYVLEHGWRDSGGWHRFLSALRRSSPAATTRAGVR